MAEYLEKFIAQRFEREGESPQYRLLSGFAYRTQALGESHGLPSAILLAPPSFEFDGSSVPRVGRSMECPGGRSIYGSCFHDFGFFFHGLVVLMPNGSMVWIDVTREIVDDIAAEAWRVDTPEVEIIGVPSVVAWLMERAVRNFGWTVWPKETLPKRFALPSSLVDFPLLSAKLGVFP